MTFNLTTPDALERIRQQGEELGIYVSTRLDEAAADAERLSTQAPRSPLHGLPYGLKDEWDTTMLPTTGGSVRHSDRQPTANCSVYQAFEEAGAVLVGKTNLSDMGLAPESTNYLVGATRNPHDPRHTAGGSSGGAAAAVAAGMQAFDWGTDIGGSIRLPAAFNGVLGMRLSAATWPITDLFPHPPEVLSWLCGQGPFTHTIPQMRAVVDAAAPRVRAVDPDSDAFKGVILYEPPRLRNWPTFVEDVSPHLEAAVDGPLQTEHELPKYDVLREAYGALWASHLMELVEVDGKLTFGQGFRAVLSSVFFRGAFGDRRFHPSTAELLMLMAVGSVTIFRDRDKALAGAEKLRQPFNEAWDKGLLIAAPSCVRPAPRVGRSNRTLDLLTCTLPGNVTDSTCISIPVGTFDDSTLPRSVQLMGPPGCENRLMDAAERFIASRDSG